MVLVNHFLDTNISGILIPNRAAADVTNSAASITAQANICVGLYGSNPNFILVGSSGMQTEYLRQIPPSLAELLVDMVFVCIARLDECWRRDGRPGYDERRAIYP